MHPGPFWGVLRFYSVLSMPLAADGRSMEVLVIVDLEQQGLRSANLVDAIDDLPLPAVRIFRDGHEVWCGAEHLAVFGLQLSGGDL